MDAGFQIRNASGWICTLGFNALHNGQSVFVTASHCSQSAYSNPDNSNEFQPTTGSQNDLLGHEFDDRPFYNCDGSGSPCRWSDAAGFVYDGGVASEVGFIARTTSVGQGQRGSLVIDGGNPRFKITTKAQAEYVGWNVYKVGRTSGWTKGPITQTCVNIDPFRCQTVALLWSEGGDSGSPIFNISRRRVPPDPDWVILYGVLWGGPPGDYTTTWYSPISGVDTDLGTYYVCDGSGFGCVPSPLTTVTINGPSSVQENDFCTWFASVSDGTPPYSYSWRKGAAPVGSGSELNMETGTNGFTLTLDVTDSGGRFGSDVIAVTVTPSGPPCFF